MQKGKPLNLAEIAALSELIEQTLDLLTPKELVELMVCNGAIKPNAVRVWLLKSNTATSKRQAADKLSETFAIAPSTVLRLSQRRNSC